LGRRLRRSSRRTEGGKVRDGRKEGGWKRKLRRGPIKRGKKKVPREQEPPKEVVRESLGSSGGKHKMRKKNKKCYMNLKESNHQKNKKREKEKGGKAF